MKLIWHLFSLVEMSVRVMCACMPSLANFVGHRFPGFSIVDSFISLKVVSFFTTRSDTNDSAFSGGGEGFIGKGSYRVNTCESGENLHRPTGFAETHNIEMGSLTPNTKTRIAGRYDGKSEYGRGIHMQQEWIVDTAARYFAGLATIPDTFCTNA